MLASFPAQGTLFSSCSCCDTYSNPQEEKEIKVGDLGLSAELSLVPTSVSPWCFCH